MAKSTLRRVLELLDDFTSVRDFLRDIGMWPALVTLALSAGTYVWAASEGVSPPYRALLVASVLVLGLLTAIAVRVWSMIRPFATPEDLARAHVSHLTFRIADLARDDERITNKTFEDCTIYGPAVLFPIGEGIGGFDTCTFAADDVRELGWEYQIGRKYHGAIGVEACVFRRCRFVKVGLAVQRGRDITAGFNKRNS